MHVDFVWRYFCCNLKILKLNAHLEDFLAIKKISHVDEISILRLKILDDKLRESGRCVVKYKMPSH